MGFSDDVPRPDPVPMKPPRWPPWMGPPENVFAGAAPVHVILARTADVLVAVRGVRVYPTGLEFDVEVRRRTYGESGRDPDPFFPRPWPEKEHDPLGPDVLRLGLEFADGQKATTLPIWTVSHDPSRPPPHPVLIPHGAVGSGTFWRQDLWLWPLPPAGPLTFVVEWPAESIPETRTDLDAARFLDAVGEAIELWPADELDDGPD